MKSAFIVSIVVLAIAGSVRMQTAEPAQNGGPGGMISSALNSITGTLSRAFSGIGQQQPQQQQPSMLGGGLNQLLSRQGSQLGGGQMNQQLMQQLSSFLDQAAREIQQVQQQLASGQLIPNMRQQGINSPISTLLQDLTTLVRNLLQLGGGRNSPMNSDFSQMLQELQQRLPLGGPQGQQSIFGGGQQGLSRNPSFNGLNPAQLGETAQNFLGNMPGPLGGVNGGYTNMQPQQGGSPINPSNLLQQGLGSLNRLPSGLSRSNSLNNMMPPQMQQMQQMQQQTPQQQAPRNGPASSDLSGGGVQSP